MKKKLLLLHPDSPGEWVVVYRGFIKRLFYPSAFATLGETLKSVQIDITHAEKFVAHIKSHLPAGDHVICTICGKTIDEIANLKIQENR